MCDDGQHGGLAGRTARALGKDVALAVVFRRANEQCISICTGVDEVWLD